MQCNAMKFYEMQLNTMKVMSEVMSFRKVKKVNLHVKQLWGQSPKI